MLFNKNKKGMAGIFYTILGAAIAFGVLIVALVLIASLLGNVQSSQPNSQATLANNVSLTWGGNNTAMSSGYQNVGCLSLYNNGTLVNAGDGVGGNYTYNSEAGSITPVNASPSGKVGFQSGWVTNTLNLSLCYSYGSMSRNITGYGLDSVKTIASNTNLLALVLVFGSIIGALLGLFLYKKTH